MKRVLIAILGFSLTWTVQVAADDTDIYLNSNNTGNKPYLMLALDYRNDLSGPYCKDSGNQSEQCLNLLNTADTFELLQALDVLVNGEPTTDEDGDGIDDNDTDLNGCPDDDNDCDGLRDSAAVMDSFEASKLEALVAVTRAVFEKFDGLFVGMMMPNADGGGTIMRGYEEFVTGDTNGAKQELIDILLNMPMPSNGNDYHESQPKEMHYEWYRYINGGGELFGDDTANNFQGTNTPAPDASVYTNNSHNTYQSPFATNPSNFECTKFFEVYATSGNEGGSDSDLSTEITASMNAASASKYEDMVAYMAKNDILTNVDGEQNLKTWIIQVGDSAAFADDWAEASGTEDQYMKVAKGADLADLQATLEAAFIEALSVSTTFVSASVPVNVFNRIQTLDNFYIALFEAESTERWPGNIKKLKLYDTPDANGNTDGEYDDIIDVNGLSAFSDEDGRLKFEALTFWTDSANLPEADTDDGEIDGRDGRSVRRGGAGQQIPGFLGDDVGDQNSDGLRQVYVEPASGSTFDDFDADNTTASNLETLLGAADTASAKELIEWARGIDVDDADNDGDTTDARPWIMGDVIHSRPLALNYGATGSYTSDNPNIRLFFGTNGGFFHIIENTTTAGAESGAEVFSFIPRESLGILEKLRTNTGVNDHPYGVDGEPVALVVDDDKDGTIETGDEVYVYFGMRRGGKSYYALDASDPSAVPTLKWKITKTSGGDFDELGYTFSTPRVATVQYDGTEKDVLIFTGGYDLQKDTDTGSGRDPDSEGNAIYIVDARTGDLVWKATDGTSTTTNTVRYHAELDHAIPSAVTIMDASGNGIVDRLYVGDSSGIVWRVDLPEGDGSNTDHRKDNWTITKLADVDDSLESQDRRFFHPPDIVQTRDSLGQYDGILIGAGDRASPLETTDVNYLYYIKDREVQSGSPPATITDDSDLADATICINGDESDGTVDCSTLDYTSGWKIQLEGSGEKGLSSPLAADGKAYFTTYTPADANDSCAPQEGTGSLYIVNLADGTAAYNSKRAYDLGPGIPPSVTAIGDDTLIIPGAGIENLNDSTSTDKDKLLQTGGKGMYIIYWRESGVDDL